jgi:hypothetical protein
MCLKNKTAFKNSSWPSDLDKDLLLTHLAGKQDKENAVMTWFSLAFSLILQGNID